MLFPALSFLYYHSRYHGSNDSRLVADDALVLKLYERIIKNRSDGHSKEKQKNISVLLLEWPFVRIYAGLLGISVCPLCGQTFIGLFFSKSFRIYL